MNLRDEEIEMIENFWNSDLDIEIERARYVAILISNVYYNHYPNGDYERKKGDKRGLYVYHKSRKNSLGRKGTKIRVIGENDKEAFKSPEEAIEFLKDKGDLRELV